MLSNLPFNNYHLVASAPGFQTAVQDVDVRSSVPMLNISLQVGTTSTTVDVVPRAAIWLRPTPPRIPMWIEGYSISCRSRVRPLH